MYCTAIFQSELSAAAVLGGITYADYTADADAESYADANRYTNSYAYPGAHHIRGKVSPVESW